MLQGHMRVGYTAGGRWECYHRRAAVIEVIRRSGSWDETPVPARVVHDRDLAGGKRDGERRGITPGRHGIDDTRQRAPQDVERLERAPGVLVGRAVCYGGR
jgi:hypothetical protein